MCSTVQKECEQHALLCWHSLVSRCMQMLGLCSWITGLQCKHLHTLFLSMLLLMVCLHPRCKARTWLGQLQCWMSYAHGWLD